MKTQHNSLRDRLARNREIKISVTGRKSGRVISVPVWFVFEQGTLYLLPVQGSDTQWYKNALKNPSLEISAQGVSAEIEVVPVTQAAQVASIVEKFRTRYGLSDVKKYYSKFDVALTARLAA